MADVGAPNVPQHLYPFAPHRAVVSGLGMHYVDEGRGHPVVMVHGNPTWSFYWRALIAGLKSDCRAIAPDHIGMGLSDKPGRETYPFTLARRCEDFAAFMDSLKLSEPVTLVVHDWGGMIGTTWAVDHPALVKRMVVLNTAAFLLPPGRSLPAALALARSKPVGELLVRGFNAFAAGATRMAVKQHAMTAEVKQGYLAPYDSWANRLSVYEFVNDIPLGEGDRSYHAVTRVTEKLGVLSRTPMMICWGGRDFVFSAPFLAEWKRHCPHAEVHEFPEAGHYVMEDAAAEIVSLVRRFIGLPTPS